MSVALSSVMIVLTFTCEGQSPYPLAVKGFCYCYFHCYLICYYVIS